MGPCLRSGANESPLAGHQLAIKCELGGAVPRGIGRNVRPWSASWGRDCGEFRMGRGARGGECGRRNRQTADESD